MDLARYRQLQQQARRLSRRAGEADDLVQDTLLAALEAGRDDAPWLAGVMRRQAALAARGALRRRRREQAADSPAAQAAPDGDDPTAIAAAADSLLRRLPPSARRVAVLALHGLSAEEIRSLLGISSTAFRQRLTRIRSALAELPPAQRADAMALATLRDPGRAAELPFGLVRRGLKAALAGRPGLGTHDADGHLLVIRPPAHTPASGGNG